MGRQLFCGRRRGARAFDQEEAWGGSCLWVMAWRTRNRSRWPAETRRVTSLHATRPLDPYLPTTCKEQRRLLLALLALPHTFHDACAEQGRQRRPLAHLAPHFLLYYSTIHTPHIPMQALSKAEEAAAVRDAELGTRAEALDARAAELDAREEALRPAAEEVCCVARRRQS